MLPSNPRFRIYSSPLLYTKLAAGLIVEKGDENTVSNLEKLLAEKFKKKYCLLMPQARVGIYHAIKALVTEKRKEIILSPYTIADVINMVICAGAIPIFADIDRPTCNITPASVRELITKNTAAVLVTHLHGITADVKGFQNLCSRKGLSLIEDAAQAFGARLDAKPAGSFGDIGIVSFGRYKNITSFYGGAVFSDDAKVIDFIKNEMVTYCPMSKKKLGKRALGCLIKDIMTLPGIYDLFTYPVINIARRKGIHFILKHIETELDLSKKTQFPEYYKELVLPVQAELIEKGLSGVDDDSEIRIRNAEIYHTFLSEQKNLITPPLRIDGSSIYTCYPLQYPYRAKLVSNLLSHGCDVGVQHIKNCADLPAFKAFYKDCPNARMTAGETIMLPTYPSFGLKNIQRTAIAVVKESV